MDRITIRGLRALVETGVAPCVTIQLPIERTGKDRLADELRLKNLTQQAEDQLIGGGMRSPDARKMLQVIRDRSKDVATWNGGGEGLAIFVDPHAAHQYRVAPPLEEFVHVGDRFCIRALLPLIDPGDQFLILALSQNRTRLLEADREGATEVDVARLPQRLDTTLHLDGADRGEQVHSGGDYGTGKQAGVFHGQGGSPDAHKENLKLFFRDINHALAPILRQKKIPLILIGVEYLLPIFRETCSYSGLTNEQVTGNFDYLNAKEIHQKVWPVMQSLLSAPRHSAAARLHELIGTEKASDNPRDVVVAAMEGRVAALFLNPRRPQWGVIDQAHRRIDVHGTFQPGDEDLLEVAAVETLRRGGEVYATDEGDMPGAESVAALYRY